MGTGSNNISINIKAEYTGAPNIKKLQDDLNAIGNIKAFEKVEVTIGKTEQKLIEAEKKAADLQKRFEETGSKADAAAYSKAAAQVDKLSASLEKQNTKLEGYAVELKKAGIAVTDLEAAQARLNVSASGKAGVLAAENVLGVRSFSAIKAEINSVTQAYAVMAASGTKSDAELAIAHQAMTAKITTLNTEMRASNQTAGAVGVGMSKLGGIIAGAFAIGTVVHFANEMTKLIDAYTQIDAKVKMVSTSDAEAAAIKAELLRLSNETGTSYEKNAAAYTKLALSLGQMGMGSRELIAILDMTNKSLVVSGASTEEAGSFMLQFSQALGSGKLAGDELRAVLESNSYFATLLAKALGTDIAGLRQMSKDGKLTTDVMREAFPKMAQEITTAYGKIPATISRSEVSMTNSFRNIVAEANKTSGVSKTLSTTFDGVAKTLDNNRPAISSWIAKMEDSAAAGAKWMYSLNPAHSVISGFSLLYSSIGKIISATQQAGSAAQKTGDDQTSAMREAAKAADLSASKQKSTFIDVNDVIKAQYKKMADEVKGILDDIAGRQHSLVEDLRAMSRTGMSDLGAWQDRKQEADELATASKKAAEEAQKLVKAGDMTAANEKFKQAIALADESKTAYKDLNKEVSDNGQIVISKSDALKQAMTGVKESGELSIQILEKQKQAAIDAGKALNDSTGGKLAQDLPEAAKMFTQVTEKARDLTEESKHFNDQWNATWAYFLSSGSENIQQLQNQLSELAKDRYITVHVQQVEDHALGGMAGIMKFAAGGSPIFRRLTSPYITAGSGLRDDVPALLTKNEFVQPVSAVERYGLRFMEAIRWGYFPVELARMFASGGLVSAAPPISPQRFQQGGSVMPDTASETINVNLSLPVQGKSNPIPFKIEKKHVQEFLSELARMHRRSS